MTLTMMMIMEIPFDHRGRSTCKDVLSIADETISNLAQIFEEKLNESQFSCSLSYLI